MPPRYWTCGTCGRRCPRIKQRCPACGRKRPRRRVPAHARTLRDDPYTVYRDVNAQIHGQAHSGEWDADACGVCGKPASTSRHHDRDHDHVTGKPRGLACPGNTGCNALMPRQLTLDRARLIVAYLERVQSYYAGVGA
jgi:Recombination endonuclease VII